MLSWFFPLNTAQKLAVCPIVVDISDKNLIISKNKTVIIYSGIIIVQDFSYFWILFQGHNTAGAEFVWNTDSASQPTANGTNLLEFLH